MEGYAAQLRHHAPALAALAAQLQRRRRLQVPDIGLPFPVVARALHRAAVEGGAWGPLAVLCGGSPERLVELAGLVAGGWLAADTPPPDVPLPCRLLLAEPTPLVLSASACAWLLAQDPHHAVATDPALRRTRELIATCAAQAELLTVIGPPGSGRRALLESAAALAGAELRDARHSGPGWWLFHEPLQLGAEALAPLAARLERPAAPRSLDLASRRPAHPELAPLIGESLELCRALEAIARWADGDAPVLVRGETGTGKELAARALHALSARATQPFVTLDPGALTGDLAVSALFGHERGAFTGASRPQPGVFARADGGTLFLDELGTLSPVLQARLLRVLDTGVIQPLGGTPRTVDVRIVAATSAPLEARIAAGAFRADLFYRLEGATVHMPPLRERVSDLPLLAEHFLPDGPPLRPEAVQILRQHAWPGNIRELRSALRRAATLAGAEPIGAAQLSAAGLRTDGPVFVTARAPLQEPPPGLQRHHLYQLAALTVHIPPLAERPPQSIRHALLSALSGAPVTGEALGLLESWPWWGGLAELRRVVGLLVRQQRTIDRALLLEVLPQLSAPTSRAPICALLYPGFSRGGQLAGLRSSHHAAALLVGRAPDLHALERAADPLSRRRWRWMSALLDGADAEALPFPQLPDLSRAQLLVTRRADGLSVHCVPETSLPVEAATVGSPLQPLAPGAVLDAGPAVEIILRPRSGAPTRFFLFLDLDAEEQAALLRGLLEPRPLAATQQQAARRLWRLSPAEAALLSGAVVAWLDTDEPLGRFVLARLRTLPGAEALVRYIDSSDPSRYCCRLFESRLNRHLCRDLRDRIGDDPRRTKLPRAILTQLR